MGVSGAAAPATAAVILASYIASQITVEFSDGKRGQRRGKGGKGGGEGKGPATNGKGERKGKNDEQPTGKDGKGAAPDQHAAAVSEPPAARGSGRQPDGVAEPSRDDAGAQVVEAGGDAAAPPMRYRYDPPNAKPLRLR
eukprot:gene47604-49903_t